MADATCACGKCHVCRHRARPRVACSVCGEPTGYPLGRVESATHPKCKPPVEYPHGLSAGERGCRCDECAAAMSERWRRTWLKRPKHPCIYCGEPTGWPQSDPRGEGASHPGCRPFEHGTLYGYRSKGCRCDECRLAWNADCLRYVKPREYDSAAARRFEVACEQCGQTGMVTIGGGRFCSLSCVMLHRGALSRSRRLPVLHPDPDPLTWLPRKHPAVRKPNKHPKLNGVSMFVYGPCAWCSEPFMAAAASYKTRVLYCSKRCQSRSHEWRHGRFQPPPSQRRRIYERDKWICQLCFGPVDPDTTDIWRPSLDHIIPQSHQLFPDHSDGNLRLTHMWCNTVRGDGRYHTDLFEGAS